MRRWIYLYLHYETTNIVINTGERIRNGQLRPEGGGQPAVGCIWNLKFCNWELKSNKREINQFYSYTKKWFKKDTEREVDIRPPPAQWYWVAKITSAEHRVYGVDVPRGGVGEWTDKFSQSVVLKTLLRWFREAKHGWQASHWSILLREGSGSKMITFRNRIINMKWWTVVANLYYNNYY